MPAPSDTFRNRYSVSWRRCGARWPLQGGEPCSHRRHTTTCLSQGMTWRLAYQGCLHTGQRGAVHMCRAQDHRDALVGFGKAIILLPVGAAASGGGAKNVAAGLTEGVGIGIAGMEEFRVTLKD